MPAKGKKSLPIAAETHRLFDIESARTGKPIYVLVAEAWDSYALSRTASGSGSTTDVIPAKDPPPLTISGSIHEPLMDRFTNSIQALLRAGRAAEVEAAALLLSAMASSGELHARDIGPPAGPADKEKEGLKKLRERLGGSEGDIVVPATKKDGTPERTARQGKRVG